MPSSSSHRPLIALTGASGACVLLALSAPALAQPPPPRADCLKTETQAECHARLKCGPDEELEECKKRRARALKEGRNPDRQDGANEGDRDGDGDVDDDDRKRAQRDGDDDRKKPRQRGGRDDDGDRKKPRQRRRGEGRAAAGQRARGRANDDDRGGGGGNRGGGVLRPGTRPGFFSGGIGPSWGVCYRGGCDPGDIDYGPTFYGTLDFGWHFSGDFEGPAIGANLHGGYGTFGPFDHGRLGVGFKFWWDVQLGDLGLYFTPFAQAGWSSFVFETRGPGCSPRFFNCSDDWEHFFNLQFGAQLRLILGNRGLLYVQPITFDNVVNGDGYGLLYHFEIGGGVIFGG